MARLFISYSHRDESLKDRLRVHMSLLEREGLVESWHDRDIEPGAQIDRTIREALEQADIVLLLVSPDFIASRYCYDIELQTALARHGRGEVRVVPVILRPCDWHTAPFGTLNALPRDGRPIAEHSDQDAAFLQVVRGLRSILNPPRASRVRETAGQSPVGAAHLQPRPERPPVRIRRSFTDLEKHRFLDQAFEHIASYFSHALSELERAHSDVETDMRKSHANDFSARVYVNGNIRAECRIWLGGTVTVNGIAFKWGTGPGDGFNEELLLDDDGYQLALRPLGMATFSSTPSRMKHDEAAEYYWTLLTKRLES